VPTADERILGDRLAALTLELCRIPSETGSEAAIADWIEARCVALAGRDAVRRHEDSVVCDPYRGSGRPGVPTVALVGHLDTVRCADHQEYTVRDGRVYGCGASDMKAGLAVMLDLLESWQTLEGARPVWIFYHGEEGPAVGNGLGPVLAAPELLPTLDFAFILEPTDRGIQPGCMGLLNATVTVPGVRAHSARPWQGENALYRALPMLERFARMERRAVRFGELTFYEVMVVTQAATQNSRNVVPDALALNVNVRFAPGSTAAAAEQELRSIVGEGATVEITDSAPSGAVHADHPLIAEWRRAEGLSVEPKQAWTDVARFTELGIPAVNFGPGETAQAHQTNEWAAVDSLVHCQQALRRFFRA
jgi:succinyl-diaminopimelate desuccinylase